MTKDLLVDNCFAVKLSNPVEDHIKEFIDWLFREGTLVVTKNLLNEYNQGARAPASPSNIVNIVDRLTRDGRLHKKTHEELNCCAWPKRPHRVLRCNKRDHDQVKAVLVSVRKLALSLDTDFLHDLNVTFRNAGAQAAGDPRLIPYR